MAVIVHGSTWITPIQQNIQAPNLHFLQIRGHQPQESFVLAILEQASTLQMHSPHKTLPNFHYLRIPRLRHQESLVAVILERGLTLHSHIPNKTLHDPHIRQLRGWQTHTEGMAGFLGHR
jgi:hypothetical protein